MAYKDKEKEREYRRANAEKIREYQREYYAVNAEKLREYQRECHRNKCAANPEQVRRMTAERVTKWRNANLELARKKAREQYAANPEKWGLANILRMRIRVALKSAKTKKCDKTLALIGCTITEARQHIEALFKPGMTWENHGRYTWHIDHIIPCAAFDLTKEEEQKKCFHYTNLQPLWAKDNLSKGARTSSPTFANTSPTNYARRLTANR